MRTYETLGLVALLILVVLLPFYALGEQDRMAQAKSGIQAQYVADAANLYLDSCALCHGRDGSGLGSTPALSNPALADANHEVLYRTIAYSPHGTTMAAWHIEEGGSLGSYQVESLVTLIKTAQWQTVASVAAASADTALLDPPLSVALEDLEPGDGEDPHECRACHDEPIVHAERFGLNCARCHNLQAWKPALLTKHTFRLDHGGGQQIDCQTCHPTNYAENTCYGCHDHQPDEMEAVHVELGATEYSDCVLCHPTGEPDEARALQASMPAAAPLAAGEVVSGN